MLNKKQLENVLYKLKEESIEWFFWNPIDSVYSPDFGYIDPNDFMYLPEKYIKKMSDFVSFHTFEYLLEMEPEDFIEQATGEKVSKILKLLEVGKKIKSINSDFEGE